MVAEKCIIRMKKNIVNLVNALKNLSHSNIRDVKSETYSKFFTELFSVACLESPEEKEEQDVEEEL